MLTPAQLAILATELQGEQYVSLLAAQEYEAIAALLNVRPEIPNPEPRAQKPRRAPYEEFLQVLTPADVVLLYQTAPKLAEEYRMYQQMGDRASGRKLWNGLKRLAFNAATITAIEALWDATEPDPDWTATVAGDSRATVLGLPRVSAADVQAVEQGA